MNKLLATAAPRGAEGPEGAFGQPRAQLRWALGHKENKGIYFLWPRGRRGAANKSKNLKQNTFQI